MPWDVLFFFVGLNGRINPQSSNIRHFAVLWEFLVQGIIWPIFFGTELGDFWQMREYDLYSTWSIWDGCTDNWENQSNFLRSCEVCMVFQSGKYSTWLVMVGCLIV
jgi:hypothetical protein